MTQLEVKDSYINDDALMTLRNQLTYFTLLDIGIIEYITDEGKARVQTWKIDGLEFNRIECEILSIGGFSGLVHTVTPGQTCLILTPCSPIVTTADQMLSTQATNFSLECAKCIPLGTYRPEQLVNLCITPAGLDIGSSKLQMSFQNECIQLSSENSSIGIRADGSLTVDLAQGKVNYELDAEGNVTQTAGYTFDKDNQVWNWLSRVKQGADGSLVVDTAGSVDDNNESFGQCTVQFGADGSIGVDVGKDKEGKVASKISVSKDGNIKLAVFDDGEEKSSITLDKAGTLDITTTDQYSIKGVGVAIDGTDGKVSIKNAQASMYDILKGMLQILNTSLATQGSPAAHTVVPNQFQQQATALDNLME